MLVRAGWHRARQKGSHQMWRDSTGTRSVIVSGKDSQTVPAGTLSEMRRRTGMEDMR